MRRIDGYEFSKTALNKVYWIATIGPHWQDGIREEDERRARPLIDWHHLVHDAASFTAFQALSVLYRRVTPQLLTVSQISFCLP